MKSRKDRRKKIVKRDRISSLPDDLVAKILSFIGMKQAVELSVLSSRWRHIWTKVPYLNFSNEDFSMVRKFYKFFNRVLSSCNNQVEMSLNLHGKVSQVLVQKILKQAYSHNLQQLTFTFVHEKPAEFPLSLFSSRSLKHLTLITRYAKPLSTSMWELPTLATLHLEGWRFYDDNTKKCVQIFSKCTNLKNLILKKGCIRGLTSFTICHTQLTDLTLEDVHLAGTVVDCNVIVVQLKNLIVINWDWELRISAPDLTSLLYKNTNWCKLSLDVDSLPCLEKVNLCISYLHKPCYGYGVDQAHEVVDLLQKCRHVKFLTLSLEIIELLSSCVEAIAHQPSPFVNLRSLKIHPKLYDEPQKMKLTMSTQIKNYLLETSPGATFTMVTREEIRAERDTISARNLMEELRVLLDVEKARTGKKEDDKGPQLCTKMPLKMGERVAQVCRYWEGLNEEIKQGGKKTSDIISLVHRINDLLIELPSSNKAQLQPHLSSLCTEADYIVSKILKCVKTGFETKESSLSVSCHQLFAAAKSSC